MQLTNSNTPPSGNILIIGCGDIGITFSHLIPSQLHIWGLRRNTSHLPKNITGITADITNPDSLIFDDLPIDYVIFTATPATFSPEAYSQTYVTGLSHCLNKLQKSRIKRFFLVSSTSVYHQNQHETVDELSPTQPTAFSGKTLLEAEKMVQNANIPHCIIRFSGIYSPDRLKLLKQIEQGKGVTATPIHYTNRIHRDDCANILWFLIHKSLDGSNIPDLLIGTDNQPAPLQEVQEWLARKMSVSLQTNQKNLPRRGGSKRCSNQRLRKLGYQFLYPTYRDGYGAIIKSITE